MVLNFAAASKDRPTNTHTHTLRERERDAHKKTLLKDAAVAVAVVACFAYWHAPAKWRATISCQGQRGQPKHILRRRHNLNFLSAAYHAASVDADVGVRVGLVLVLLLMVLSLLLEQPFYRPGNSFVWIYARTHPHTRTHIHVHTHTFVYG